MSFRKWWKFAYKNNVRERRIKRCSYLQYKSSEETMSGIFVQYSTRPIYDVSMNLFCWPPSVDIFNILPGFLWQPLLIELDLIVGWGSEVVMRTSSVANETVKHYGVTINKADGLRTGQSFYSKKCEVLYVKNWILVYISRPTKNVDLS